MSSGQFEGNLQGIILAASNKRKISVTNSWYKINWIFKSIVKNDLLLFVETIFVETRNRKWKMIKA